MSDANTNNIRRKKTLQELTITDGFLFVAVMLDPENCRLLLERILEISIDHVEVITEKNIIYHPEYKGVRLDVYAKDDKGTRFDVEMQVEKTPVGKRSRYYHSQMDMEMLTSGTTYDKLPDSYVIFICDYQPLKEYGQPRYRYTFRSQCQEDTDIDMNDGVHTIILSNKGTNDEEISAELLSFLQFTNRALEENTDDSEDLFIRRLQNSIRTIKADRAMGERYMLFQEMLNEEREEGRKEGQIKLCDTLIKNGTLTIDQAAASIGMTVEEFEKALSQLDE